MKAISLWQPWASLIACGAKPYETRHWAPPRSMIGQPVAIHAAKKIDREAAEFAQDILYGQIPELGGFDLADELEATWSEGGDDVMGVFGAAVMPIGCVVAIARLSAAFQIGENGETVRQMSDRPVPSCFRVKSDSLGNYAAGRWAWLLRDVRPINPPIPMKGAQGFFDLPQGWLTRGGQ